MKRTFRYILLTVATLVPVLASAQSGTDLPDPDIYDGYKLTGGVATKKTVGDPDSNGLYTITLETFATGTTTIINKAIPSDIILLLDYSSSMLMTGSAGVNSESDTRTRLYDLKNAVGEFVEMMRTNNTEIGLTGAEGNRIAFILYAGELYGSDQDDFQTGSGNNTHGIFHAEHLGEWLPVSDLTPDPTITEHHPVWTNTAEHNYASTSIFYNDGIKTIDIISPASQNENINYSYNGPDSRIVFGDVNKGTNSGAAMQAAGTMVSSRLQAANLNTRNLVVVMFTDGEPSVRSGFDNTTANACISAAHDIKEKDVTVYTIGLVEGSDDSNRVKTYLEYTSSDFSKVLPEGNPNNPTAMPASTATSNLYLDRNANYGPYCFKVSEEHTLSDIFKTIGEASGGSEATIPGETQVVDCVSNSFEVPSSFKASDVVVYTRAVSTNGKTWGTAVPMSTQEVNPGNNPPMTVEQPAEGKIGIALKDGKLTVVGFEYSGDDNWVGWRDENTCAGKELVIEFKIEANPNATGGDGTNTNTADSGVYVPQFDDAGNIIGYSNVNKYDVPHKDIPINLVIKKTGLRHGESATIQIYMSHQKNVGGKIQYSETTGKPLPEATLPTSPDQDPNDLGWEDFTKVILTNLGEDGAEVTKTLLALDATYVYLLAEDNWGWAYVLDDKMLSTSEVETNPFEFNNTERTDAPKHAEAVSINHFGDNPHVQNAKSSKVKTFTTGGGSSSGSSE